MQLRDRASLPSGTATSGLCLLEGMPLEIVEMIFGECNIKDLPSLLQTAKFVLVQNHHVDCTDIRMLFMQPAMAMI